MRKTNLEELNYRFRKELLNNYGYKLYISLLHSVESETLEDGFDYSLWVKGLFKKDGIDNYDLIKQLPYIFDESFEIEDEFWREDYARYNNNFLDLINISHLVSIWISLYYQLDNSDEYFWSIGLKLANSQFLKEYISFHHENNDITIDDLQSDDKSIANQKEYSIKMKWVSEFVKRKVWKTSHIPERIKK